MSFRLTFYVILAAGASALGADPPLTTAQAVRNLTPDEAGQKRAVRIAGVVTHVSPQQGDFFIQDETAGIYVQQNAELAAGLKPGDRVEVDATTAAGGFAPCLTATSARVTGTSPLPEPTPYNLSRDDSRWLDGQFVQGTAVVQKVEAHTGITRLEVYSPNGRATLYIHGEEHLAKVAGWVNATVRFRGVCAPRFDADRRVKEVPRVHVPSPEHVKVLRTADKAPETDPPLLIEALSRFSPSPDVGGRWVKVSGVVTALLKHSHFVVQDDTAGILVSPDSAADCPVVGERVEVVGFVGFVDGHLHLTAARVRSRAAGRLPDPLPVTGATAAGRPVDFRRVQITGTVKRVAAENGVWQMLLAVGVHQFEVIVPHADASLSAIPTDADVEVTAVAVPRPAASGGPNSLFVPSADGMRVVALPPDPPWWTPQRVTAAVSGLLAVLATAAVWVWTLRRQVRQQTTEIRGHFDKERELEEKLKQAGKLEAMGRLAGGVAHDFNNLLTVINGCAEMLAARLPAGQPDRRLCDDVLKAGQRAAALTAQMLLFSRKRAVTLTLVDLNATLREGDTLLSRVIGEHIRVDTLYADDLPPVRADVGYLNQVVLNLAVNARDAMPAGGIFTLSTAAEVRADGTPAVRLSVADTGCGMDDDTARRVFEPFFTTKPRGQGTGLGLATVYGIVQTLGGEIHFETAVGRGTTFHILLPAAGEHDLPAVALDPPSETPALVPVLLVEDDEGVRDFVQRALELSGYPVTAVHTPAEAEELSDAELKRAGVLLTDVVMPGKNGRELAESLRARHPALKVVFMSGYTTDEVLGRGVNDGEVVFLQKPFHPHDLIRVLNEVLRPNGR